MAPTRAQTSVAVMSIARLLAPVREELELAMRFDRPSLVLVVSDSPATRREARAQLTAWLEAKGVRVESLKAGKNGNEDIPLVLSRKRLRHTTVYYIAGLAEGGRAALTALNIRREYFVEQRLRVVLWLDGNEEKSVAESAPDFWAFRHQVVYL